MKKMIVLGATSAMAEAYTRLVCKKDIELILISRDTERMDALKGDYESRGSKVIACLELALDAPHNVLTFIESNKEVLQGADMLLTAAGTLPEQGLTEHDTSYLLQQFNINGLSIIAFINEFLKQKLNNEQCTIAAISSVAGDRGRQSNFLYGSAKSALSIFLEGLMHKYHGSNITIIDVKPGFVDTPMTQEFNKGVLWAKPEKIAQIIDNKVQKNKSGVVYAPWFWYWIMFIIRSVPRFVFHKTNL